jgi:transposase InsO family protein
MHCANLGRSRLSAPSDQARLSDYVSDFTEDHYFGERQVIDVVKSFGIEPKRTSFRSPWQNGVAERWVGNCRRDLLDHVIVLNERHLKRLMSEYLRYYDDDRTHLALEKQSPGSRLAAKDTDVSCKVLPMPRLGGLHHRYDLAA